MFGYNDTMKQADVWIVAGAVGAGKTTVCNLLLEVLTPTPALLDKDTLYVPLEGSFLSYANRPLGEREGPWYDEHIKKFVYDGLTDAAKEIRSKGCPVMLSGPFTKQIHNKEIWDAWVEALGGGNVHLVWIQTDAATLRSRIKQRNSPRDSEKLKHFDEFVAYMQLDSPPPFPHMTIDNRLTASESLENQIQKLL